MLVIMGFHCEVILQEAEKHATNTGINCNLFSVHSLQVYSQKKYLTIKLAFLNKFIFGVHGTKNV
jgi:hypothetical protein